MSTASFNGPLEETERKRQKEREREREGERQRERERDMEWETERRFKRAPHTRKYSLGPPNAKAKVAIPIGSSAFRMSLRPKPDFTCSDWQPWIHGSEGHGLNPEDVAT